MTISLILRHSPPFIDCDSEESSIELSAFLEGAVPDLDFEVVRCLDLSQSDFIEYFKE